MKRTIHILILMFLLSFIACKKANENENLNEYIKEWKSTKKPFPYSATLKINKNNTFEFSSGACTSASYSKGKWEIINDTIILNSFKPKECCLLIIYGGNCEKYGKVGENNEFEKSIKDCDFKTENSYDVFENAKFYIKNKNLIFKKSKINDCEDLKEMNFDFELAKNSI